jgi:threonylcarbamoyladenosine tRNA methylthiotransferase CDKAL1
MEDIEDIKLPGGADGIGDRFSGSRVPMVVPKPPKNNNQNNNKQVAEAEDSSLPLVYVKTWGCSHNSSDAEYMAGLLAEYGFPLAENGDDAKVWVLNSCTVKNPSEDAFRNAIRSGKEQDKVVVLAGCVPQADRNDAEFSMYSAIGVNQIDRCVEVVEQAIEGNVVRLLGNNKKTEERSGKLSLLMPKIRRNKLIEIVPINSGCLNQCTYCKTKHSRGDLNSYHPDEIVQRVSDVVHKEGVMEIWLSSEDTGAYGRDIGESLPNLLRRIVDVLPHHARLRIGMTNPPYILEHLKEIAEIMQDPRVYKFLHLPVQAASNRVLDEMRRQYTKEEFSHVVEFLRENVPGINIATDIICGFPGETQEEFEETLELVSKYQFPALHISQFYPRKGTPAARMKRVPTQEVKRRSREMTKLFNSYETLGDKVGKVYRVLCTDIATDKKHYVAHNEFFDQVIVPMDESLMGAVFDVKITQAAKFYLVGEPIEGTIYRDEESQYKVMLQPPVVKKPKEIFQEKPAKEAESTQLRSVPAEFAKKESQGAPKIILYSAIGFLALGIGLALYGL